jgi:peptidase C13-like protein
MTAHELRILGANIALFCLLGSVLFVVRAMVRRWRLRRMAHRALIHGHPRKYRAILRSLGRLPGRPLRPWLALQQSYGLFWEGSFDRTLAHVEPLAARADVAALWSLSVTLKIQCLAFSYRVAEARRLFDAHVRDLVLVKPMPYSGADEETLEALLQFYEGSLESSRSKLEASLERLDPRWPMSRVVHFHLAAIAHRQGQRARAGAHLAAAMRGGGELFVAKWAAHAHADLFPGSVAAPLRTDSQSALHSPGPKKGLFRNLAAGLTLLSFRKSALGRMTLTYEQTILLALVNVLCVGLLRCLAYSRGATFLQWGALAVAAPVLSFAITGFLATRTLRPPGVALPLTGAFYSALPWLLVIEWAGTRVYRNGSHLMVSVVQLAIAGWSLAVFLFIARRLAPRAGLAHFPFAAAVFATTWLVPMHYAEPWPMWMRPTRHSFEDDQQAASDFMFNQATEVLAAESRLAPERRGIEDLYFVGFAGWGSEDVFIHEVQSAQKLFDGRFDTRAHSLVLSNDPSTRDTLPAATTMNLGHVLKAIGAQMNREQDVLFLFLTSHGSDTGLSIGSAAFPMFFMDTELAPGKLRSLLDDSGIKWRVLMISSCRSGVFVGPLQNEFTLIATASASDRVSFGCGQGREFTEFGRAVIAEQLAHERSFPVAFAKAADTIKEREIHEGRTPSQPQLFVGSAIAEKLHALEARVGVRGI